jgi:HK97 family phage major capsid protein
MLDSIKIQRRQSEIRQTLAGLVGKEKPEDNEVRQIEALDLEFRTNETRYRAALIAEDQERREAGSELETRSEREFSEMLARFELRQVALHLDEGRQLDGQTAEIVQELRNAGGYRGIPVPWQALEVRTGETISTGTPDPISTRPIIDRLFPASVAGAMGGQMINIDSGAVEWPVVTSSVSAGWQTSETGAVGGPTAYATTDKSMKPDHTLGITMKVTRRALKQSGAALEAAIRRDMQGAMAQAMDLAVFRGTGADGQPLGLLTTPATYGITATAVGAAITSAVFRARLVAFMNANAIASPSAVRALIRPEAWDKLHTALVSGTAVSEWDRLTAAIPEGNFTVSGHALAAPAGSPLATSALLTTASGGVAPFYLGLWGAIDVIRDPYSDAASGGLRITALGTMDVTVARGVQLQIMTGLQ